MKEFDRQTLLRYTAFQLPSLVLLVVILYFLGKVFTVSLSISALIITAWIIKDILLYPLLARYYRPSFSSAVERFIGREGTVSSDINPDGYIRLGIELWRAKHAPGSAPLKAGDRAEVVSVDGFTLYVKNCDY